jgi:hypothetical protein
MGFRYEWQVAFHQLLLFIFCILYVNLHHVLTEWWKCAADWSRSCRHNDILNATFVLICWRTSLYFLHMSLTTFFSPDHKWQWDLPRHLCHHYAQSFAFSLKFSYIYTVLFYFIITHDVVNKMLLFIYIYAMMYYFE